MTEKTEARVAFMYRVKTAKGWAHKFAELERDTPTPTARLMTFDLGAKKLVPGGLYTVNAVLDDDGHITTIYANSLAYKGAVERPLQLAWWAEDDAVDAAKRRATAEKKAKEGGPIKEETDRLCRMIADLPRNQRRAVATACADRLHEAVYGVKS